MWSFKSGGQFKVIPLLPRKTKTTSWCGQGFVFEIIHFTFVQTIITIIAEQFRTLDVVLEIDHELLLFICFVEFVQKIETESE